MDFGKWVGIHDSTDQKKRLASAKGAACTPLSISRDEPIGVFSGSHGVYQTSLDACACVDFARRKLPCKHMYRLAIELGLIDETAKADSAKIRKPIPQGQSLANAIAVVEKLSDTAQHGLLDVLRTLFYREKNQTIGIKIDDVVAEIINSGILSASNILSVRLSAYRRNELRDTLLNAGITGFSKNMRRDIFIEWICNNVPDASEIFSDAAAVSVADDYLAVSRKMYTYLIRKYEEDFVEDMYGGVYEVPKGAKVSVDTNGDAVSVCFPHDEVTVLLEHYGHNRCLDWTL